MRGVGTVSGFGAGLAAAFLLGGAGNMTLGRAQPGAKASPPAAAATQALVSPSQLPVAGAPPPAQLVEHAINAGLGQCAPVLERMTHEIIRGPANVQSGWNLKDPTGHVFQSVAGLRHPGNRPENALAAFIAAPLANSDCDGVAVQVYPLPQPCGLVQDVAQKGGRQIADLEGVRVVLDAHQSRLFLLPGGVGTCIAVSVKSYFAGG